MLTRETKFFLSMMTSICFGRDYRMTLQNRSTALPLYCTLWQICNFIFAIQ
jgi:hypothetical protein